ncbi:MAG: hypothetical protein ACTSRP_11540 [Candidatus Helarchaeota archaeon]
MSSEEKIYIRCPICGHKINILDNEVIACKSCPNPFKSKCELIKCDNCGYEFPPNDPKLLKFLKKIRKNKKI